MRPQDVLPDSSSSIHLVMSLGVYKELFFFLVGMGGACSSCFSSLVAHHCFRLFFVLHQLLGFHHSVIQDGDQLTSDIFTCSYAEPSSVLGSVI